MPGERPHALLLYAHRGAAAEQPENTLGAFRRALELGATALETDAHLTADGHVVLSHDATGARMGGVERPIRDAILAEVQRWDVGWGFRDKLGARPFAGCGYRIPTLAEVLSVFPTVPLNVDAKQHEMRMARALVQVITRAGAERHTRITSFDEETLRQVRGLGYPGPTGLSRAEVMRAVLLPRIVSRLVGVAGDAIQIPIRVGVRRLATRAVIDKFHALGLRVDYWTINEPREACRLLELGADGIMTDDPGAIAPVFTRARAHHIARRH